MLYLNAAGKTPLYQQLYEQIKKEILAGIRSADAGLPSIRTMAKELQLGKNTVENAYAQLVLEGYVRVRPGSGYRVNRVYSHMNAAELPHVNTSMVMSNEKKTTSQKHIDYDFNYENLDASIFPAAIWRRLMADILSSLHKNSRQAVDMHAYGDACGSFSLRSELVSYLYRSRGVCCTPEQVIICSGLQPAIIAVMCLLQDKCAFVAIEDPGYAGARAAYELFNADILSVPVKSDGIDIESLAASSAGLVHIAPSHQFPTGVVMPICRRIKLLEWASKNDGFIIEDDYDSELRYHGRPIPSLQSIDENGRVIYMGTFSKVLSPGMRMSYMVLPPLLAARFRSVFSDFQCTVPWLEQAVLSSFIKQGHWEKHLRKICLLKKKKHDLFVHTVDRLFGKRVRIHGHNAGLHLLLEFPAGPDEASLVAKAATCGVRVYPASPFWRNREHSPANCLFLGYGTLTEPDIITALERLEKVWFCPEGI